MACLLGGVVLKWASEFERAAANDYEVLAAKTEDPRLKALLQELAREELEHLDHVQTAAAEHQSLQLTTTTPADTLPARGELRHDVSAGDRPILEHAIEHEEATARFYLELAQLTPLPSLKQTFTALAHAEEDHAQRLQAWS